MEENLKTFVSNLVNQEKNEKFPNLYIVDKETGPYRKIQEAIDAAEPSSLIKISEGFYEENLVIKYQWPHPGNPSSSNPRPWARTPRRSESFCWWSMALASMSTCPIPTANVI